MTDRHPMYHAVCLWAGDPETWAWQWRHSLSSWRTIPYPPSVSQSQNYEWRLVHADWLRDLESVTVYMRPRNWSVADWVECYDPPDWDHETYEYRVEPRARTGRMTEAPKNGTRYTIPQPHLASWHDVLMWRSGEYDRMLLERGLCHYDADSAIAAAKKMVEATQQSEINL